MKTVRRSRCCGCVHKAEYGIHHGLISGGRIEHGVVYLPVRPLNAKIFFDESSALAIHGSHQRLRVRFPASLGHKATHLIFCRSVKKDAQSIAAMLEKELRSPAYDHAFALGGRLFNHTL